MAGLSKSRVDRAGARLRAWWLDENADDLDEDQLAGPADDLYAWRETFQTPLTKVVMGLRSMVQTVRPELKAPAVRVPVGQRLKRGPQMVAKLGRHPTMRLSAMQDIGGCRAIMPGGRPEVLAVADRIVAVNRWDVRATDDYVESPGPTGYRALHLIVLRDDRLIEVQLRTSRQHQWAEAVERTALRVRQDLKNGEGDKRLLDYFEMAARGLAMEDAGEEPDEGFQREFAGVSERARPFFQRPT